MWYNLYLLVIILKTKGVDVIIIMNKPYPIYGLKSGLQWDLKTIIIIENHDRTIQKQKIKWMVFCAAPHDRTATKGCILSLRRLMMDSNSQWTYIF